MICGVFFNLSAVCRGAVTFEAIFKEKNVKAK